MTRQEFIAAHLDLYEKDHNDTTKIYKEMSEMAKKRADHASISSLAFLILSLPPILFGLDMVWLGCVMASLALTVISVMHKSEMLIILNGMQLSTMTYHQRCTGTIAAVDFATTEGQDMPDVINSVDDLLRKILED